MTRSAGLTPTLTFLGGARTVTGSKSLLGVGGRALLVDCGLFQGQHELRRRNWEPFPAEVGGIDAVLLHHLAHQLPDPRNTVVLVGFQAAGTRGRALLEGARSVKIHGSYVPVRADIADLEEYSENADADDILGWLGAMPTAPSVCFVVHGEPDSSFALRDRIAKELSWTAVVPESGERVLLG